MKFHEVVDEHQMYPSLKTHMPKRATANSAGYDFYTKAPVTLVPNKVVYVHTDVKVELEPDEVLLIVPRSSLAMKHGILLANQVAVIDADFFSNPNNDGNITIALRYMNQEEKKQKNMPLRAGTRVAQGIVVKYQTEGEDVDAERLGGIGSTGL